MALRLWVLASLLLCGMPALAQDWDYRVRPGDTLWDLSARYLKPSIAWERLQAHNRVADPYRLPPGTPLRFPVAWLQVQPAPAKVIAVRGQVQASAEGGGGSSVAEGDLLRIGQTLQTGANASVTIEFADASRLQLRENSRLRLDQLSRYGHTGMVDTRLRLEQGRSSNRVTPAKGPASRYIIDAPTATSSVRGTLFRVSAGQDGRAAATEVIEGRVQVGNRGGQQMVAPGQASRSPAAELGPGAPQALLPAPRLETAALLLETLPARVAWQAVAGADHYRLEVVRGDQPEILLYAQDAASPPLTVPELPPGTLRLLLRAVSADGVEGLDAQADFQVHDQPVAPLTVSPLSGQTVYATRPRFEWTRAPGAQASVLQVARDASFLSPVLEQETRATHLRSSEELAPGQYFWRVASRDAAGHRGGFGQALPVTLSLQPPDPALQAPQAARGQLTLRWQAAGPDQRYRVQLDRKGDFRRPLLDNETERPEVTLKRPWRGPLHVRVQVIDADGYAGPFSPAQQVQLPCRSCQVGGGALLLLLLL